MVRIGGKGMTSKLDRIQENANEYIVKNCPCYALKGGYYDCWANQDTWCENVTDCVIKQVIEKCKEHPFKDCACGDEILQLFDIEEINK